MIIVDAHQNIAFNAQQLGRDYTRWTWHTRRGEAGGNRPPAVTSLPDNLLSGVAIVFASLIVIPESWHARQSWQSVSYRTDDDARQLAMWQLDYYRRLADEQDNVSLVLAQSDLDQVLETWTAEHSLAERRQGIVISMDGADPILEPKQFEEWLELGVRVVAPACLSTRYCAAAGSDGELTLLGYDLLEVLASFNILLDLAHMSERAAQQALQTYEGALIASHANPRHFHDDPRNLSDETIRSLAERDGVMGIMMYNQYLRRDWHSSDPKRNVTLSHWVDAVDYVCQLTGSAEYVGLGSDIDAGYAYHQLPDDLDSSSDLWLLERELREHGFSEADTELILGGNMLRKLRETLPGG